MRLLLPLLCLAACALPDDDLDGDGWSRAAGDCDDLDPRVNPDAADEIGDGIDQDCNGIDPLMVVFGADHTCEMGADHSLWCSGDNSLGQLDVPETDDLWVKITAGAHHTCALSDGGEVACWGDDTYGQATPPFPSPWADVSAGSDYTVGVRTVGIAQCWGRCVGQKPN